LDQILHFAINMAAVRDAGERVVVSSSVSACIELIIRVMRLEVGLDAGKVHADMPVKVRRPDDGIGARIDHAPGSVTGRERIATV
jgi:hypothetical protein